MRLPQAPYTPILAALRRTFSRFLLALSFLTRLGPSRAAQTRELAGACVYYPAVGLCIGLLLVCPLYFGLFRGHATLQAWTYVCLSAWLTRALHLDGLADLCDAAGSGKRGEAFQAILKDSRLGAFGAVGLLLVLSGQLFCAADLLQSATLAPLVFAPVFGRCLPIPLALLAPPSPTASLGVIVSAAPKFAALAASLIGVVLAGAFCLTPPSLALLLVATSLLLYALRRLAERNGGVNGDFFGAVIVCGELLFMMASVLG
jgi:adenosylcobinamide-GDP ribazoletransferase